MKAIAPELLAIVAGLLLLSVGLSVWFGWYVAATVVGVLLLALGAWSAAAAVGDRGQ